MKSLDTYLKLQQEIYDYFGYKEEWHIFPIDDNRGRYWQLEGTEFSGTISYADKLEGLNNESLEYYQGRIYNYGHLPKWVYRGKEYTLIVVDTGCDFNVLLMIFSNDKEKKLFKSKCCG